MQQRGGRLVVDDGEGLHPQGLRAASHGDVHFEDIFKVARVVGDDDVGLCRVEYHLAVLLARVDPEGHVGDYPHRHDEVYIGQRVAYLHGILHVGLRPGSSAAAFVIKQVDGVGAAAVVDVASLEEHRRFAVAVKDRHPRGKLFQRALDKRGADKDLLALDEGSGLLQQFTGLLVFGEHSLLLQHAAAGRVDLRRLLRAEYVIGRFVTVIPFADIHT